MLHGRLHTFHAVTLKMFLYTLQPSVASTFFPWESTQILQNIAPFSINSHGQIFNQFSCIFCVCLATFGVETADGGGGNMIFFSRTPVTVTGGWSRSTSCGSDSLSVSVTLTLADLSGQGDGPGLLCSVAFVLDSILKKLQIGHWILGRLKIFLGGIVYCAEHCSFLFNNNWRHNACVVTWALDCMQNCVNESV